ncbi:phenylacetaldehyde reductase-like [Diospyros lotus]|uniref:phenylacetaldehyde reductase-like n=1 Tax=Diospyros lotus TaxID=55363 RepID=UPI002250C905|nr:phenylacetaldehyde reductase-like [Diospyros lotus]
MSSGAGKVVCVTGASGYIASWLVKLLLRRGYSVNATVRDPDNLQKTGNLLALDGAKERLHLFKANLLEERSFDRAIEGCECVFHTASPIHHEVNDPQVELIDPALKGTLNVLKSCAQYPSVKRVIVTSSMAAVAHNGNPLTSDVVVDETWFSDPVFVEKLKNWYMLSKTLAEEAAWKFSKENGIDMVVLNPGLVIGPLLQQTFNESVEMILKLINGAPTFPNVIFRLVDVRDVANAHIQAFEIPSANGRYCLVGRTVHCSDVLKILSELYPELKLPERCMDEKPFISTYQVSKDRAKTLGIDFIPTVITIKDTVESLKEKNFISL